jgi:hypothetical protein
MPALQRLLDQAAAQIQHLLLEWFLYFSATYRESNPLQLRSLVRAPAQANTASWHRSRVLSKQPWRPQDCRHEADASVARCCKNDPDLHRAFAR